MGFFASCCKTSCAGNAQINIYTQSIFESFQCIDTLKLQWYQYRNDHIEERENQTPQKCGSKTLNTDAWNEDCYQPKYHRVDNQEKESKGKNCEG